MKTGSSDRVSDSYPLRQLIGDLRSDINYYGSKSLAGKIWSLLFNLSLQVVLLYRFSRYLSNRPKLAVLSKPFTYMIQILSGCHISPRSSIGRRLSLPHPTGIVIGVGVVIEDDVVIYQHVTAGSHGREGSEKKYPIINSGAIVYAGSTVIGGISIGKQATIGANSVVTIDVPDDGIAAGTPARLH